MRVDRKHVSLRERRRAGNGGRRLSPRGWRGRVAAASADVTAVLPEPPKWASRHAYSSSAAATTAPASPSAGPRSQSLPGELRKREEGTLFLSFVPVAASADGVLSRLLFGLSRRLFR